MPPMDLRRWICAFALIMPAMLPLGSCGRESNTASAPAEAEKQAPAFKPDVKKKPAGTWTLGTRVKHAKYGYGTILRTEGAGDDLKLTVSFISHGLKKMIAKYAELEVV